jgi:hypothetical protein
VASPSDFLTRRKTGRATQTCGRGCVCPAGLPGRLSYTLHMKHANPKQNA